MSAEQSGQLRVGVIGLGFAGTTALKSFRNIPGVEVVALAGQERDRLEALGAEHAIPNLFTDYQDLLALPGLDAISIGVPNGLHRAIAVPALERGLHVLCEKPLARNAREAEEMVLAARHAGRVLQVVFNHRERGDVQLLRRYVDEGRLGRIYYAKAYWMRRRGIPGMGSWFVSKEEAGGGCLIDLGVHVLDMAMFLMGEPGVRTVSASTFDELGKNGAGFSPHSRKSGADNPFTVEDLGTAFIRLDGGTTLLLEASWASHGSQREDYGVVLYGTEGGAEIKVVNYGQDDTLNVFTTIAGELADIHPTLPHGGFHQAVIGEFVERVRSGEWTRWDGSDGLRYARVIDACYASGEQGREIVLEAPGDATEVPTAAG
ncbi:MAG TPA: Gfo/Idh/MocA family oxidoreductase [Candidatus Dormibacteraeota bacterium]|nr:Gfo/Idh/MocA family oxidoreductase [Candidatus Dormibacteraeota bacterium]